MHKDIEHRENYAIKLTFKVTNNEGEYEALLVGMSMARPLGATKIRMKKNFQMVVS